MIRVKKICGPVPQTEKLPVPAHRLVFLDIETTGLKAGAAMLYLAGVLYAEQGSWNLQQFFAEKRQEEPEVLRELSAFLEKRDQSCGGLILASYNGDVFDLPWIRTLEKAYYMKVLPESAESLDLYRAIRPYRPLTGLADCHLPSVERFCGYSREDQSDGGELTVLYESYLTADADHPEEKICFQGQEYTAEEVPPVLLCHNRDDLEGLPCLLSVLGYRSMAEGGFTPLSAETDGTAGKEAECCYRLRYALPAGFEVQSGQFRITVPDDRRDLLKIRAVLFEGELKRYYPDWKEYYYLPAEDTAVHRSLGTFVDRRNRVRASAANCYTRQSGTFLPLPGRHSFPETDPELPLYTGCLHGEPWVLWGPQRASDREFLMKWGKAVLNLLPCARRDSQV